MMPTGRRFSELNAYRGIAALLVVVFHAYQYSREGTHAARYLYEGTPLHTLLYSLDTPVSWFFSLSGFFLFLPYAQAIRQGQVPQQSRVFLFRRALRVVPLYFLCILIVWSLRYTSQPGQWTDLFEHLTFTHIWDSRYIFYTIGPAWSLGDEAVFYAMLAVMGPVVYTFTARATPKTRQVWLIAFPLGVVMISVLYKLVMHFGLGLPASGMAWMFNPVAHADSFGLGMVLASLSALGIKFSQRHSHVRLALGALILLAVTFVLRPTVAWVDVFAFSLSALAFTVLLASTVLTGRSAQPEDSAQVTGQAVVFYHASTLSRFLKLPVWLTLSSLSYGIYLWHEPLMLELSRAGLLISPQPGAFWLNAVTLLILSLILAALTYWTIERPLLSARNLLTPEGRVKDDYATERWRYRLNRYHERRRQSGKGGVL